MNIKLIAIDVLTPYVNNTRTHSDEQVSQIAASITEFGFTNPILVDENNVLIAGHGRLLASKKLGMTEVPTLQLSHLTEAQKKAYIIADNRLALNAGWDDELLALELSSLKALDFNLDLLGFNDGELEKYLNVEDLNNGLTDPDALPDAPVIPITIAGDIWLMDGHRLMCGSSTEAASVALLLNGQQPNTMITDPPYGVKYEAGWRSKAKDRTPTDREINSNLMNDNQADWFEAYNLFTGSVAYVWHASAFTDVVMDGLKRAGFEIKQQIIWNKNVHALSRSDYHWKHEPCWYAVRNSKDRNWKGGRTQMTVWDIKSISTEKDKTAHPTKKPVEIYTRSLEFHTNSGEYVYEPFGGSGTAIIACEKLGRRSLTMELDSKYCDVIVDRWQRFTGKKAILESSGMAFEAVMEQRNG